MPDSFKATYECGFQTYSQWLHFEHFGTMRNKARIWWERMGGFSPCPKTVTEALQRAESELKWVSSIEVRKNGKYHDITAIHFGPAPEPKPARVRVERAREENMGGRSWSPPPRAPQSSERTKTIDKIVALRSKRVVVGCTEDEERAAQAKAFELMSKYGISVREVEDAEVPF